MSGFDLAIESIKSELRSINLKLSNLRKAGLDTRIAELKAMNLAPKIQYAEISQAYKDVEKINKQLDEVKGELNEIENSGAGEGASDLLHVKSLIEKVEQELKDKRMKEAKDYYAESAEAYGRLGNEDKKMIFEKLNNVRSKLTGEK